MQYVQQPPRDVDPVRAAELEAPFIHHGLNYSGYLTSVTAVKPFVEPLEPFDFQDCTGERRRVLRNDCRVRVLEEHHRLKVLTSFPQSHDMVV